MRSIPNWLARTDEVTQNNVLTILERWGAVNLLLLPGPNGQGDKADLEGARLDLKDTLAEIFETGKPERNPLWDAIMMIRPQVIGGWIAVSVMEELNAALRNLKNEYAEQAAIDFFGRLTGMIKQHKINFFRAVIRGEPLTTPDGKFHFFPGILYSVRMQAGVRLSSAPDNVEPVIKAYKLMTDKTAGNAKTAMEAITADVEELSKQLYLPKK